MNGLLLSAWHLLWIVPLALSLGVCIGGVLAGGKQADDVLRRLP
jgi:hypothetical protein